MELSLICKKEGAGNRAFCMKKHALALLIALGLILPLVPATASALCTPFLPVQGGTGNCGLKPTFIYFGGTTATTPFATSSAFFFTTALNQLTLGVQSGTGRLRAPSATAASGNDGGKLQLDSGSGDGVGGGGELELNSGSGGASANGGNINATAGDGGATSGDGGSIGLAAGAATGGGGNGGDITLTPGAKNGAGIQGFVTIFDAASGIGAVLDTTSLSASDKTFTLPNTSGTFCLTTTCLTSANTLSTTSPWTVGQVAYVADNGHVTSVATGTVSSSGNVSVTAARNVLGGALTITVPWAFTPTTFAAQNVNSTSTPLWLKVALPSYSLIASSTLVNYASSTAMSAQFFCLTGDTCRSTWPTGTVTSITAGSGLNGGAITTAGTISLLSYISTSSSETATNVSVWASTAGTPAQLSGGDTTFTFTSATKKLVFLNGTSTNLSVTGSFFAPTTATVTATNANQVQVNTTSASSSLAFGANQLFATTSVSFMWSTTTPASTATDTIMIVLGPRGTTYNNMACRTTGGTSTVAIGTGAATSTYYIAGPKTPTPTTLTANNSFEAWQSLFIAIGNYSASTIPAVTCGFGRSYTY